MESKWEFSKIDIPNNPEYATAAGKYMIEAAGGGQFDLKRDSGLAEFIKKLAILSVIADFDATPGQCSRFIDTPPTT